MDFGRRNTVEITKQSVIKMENKLEVAVMIVLLLASFILGYGVRDVQGQDNADQYLVGKIQDAQADRNGFEQLYNTCTWELDNERTVELQIDT